MSSLFALLLGLFSSQAETLPQLRFTYEPVEGAEAARCTHKQIRDLPDYEVSCETAFGKKTYTAHVIVREYPKGDTTGLEILYWVSEPGEKPTSPHTFHSTSALLNLKGKASLENFTFSQGVENDFASLVLGWGR